MADRYELLGTIPQEREDNSGLTARTADAQKAAEGSSQDQVVGGTNDREEAEHIRKMGGYIRSSDGQWVVVTGYRDTTHTPSSSSGPISKDQV